MRKKNFYHVIQKRIYKGFKKQKPSFIIPFGREDLLGIALQIYTFKLYLQYPCQRQIMNFIELEKLFSYKRLSTYYNLFPTNKEKAIEYYRLNIQIAESLYPLLSNLEIVLRNSIHSSFSIHYGSENWFSVINQPELLDQVQIAKRKILIRQHQITVDKVVAELTFGFWTSLFNKKYAKDFWKPLMYAFPHLTTINKRRDKIAFKLNHIRKFRNRIFHYEPICNDLIALATNHCNILELLNWINTDIVNWTKDIDRFDSLYKEAISLRTQAE